MSEDKHTEWFESWFDSPYYHVLYKNRDFSEAELFIDKLIQLIEPAKASRVLDLACGKGRHSIYLNKKGFDVTGIDLSEKSIACAKTAENETLHFYMHDMRKLFRTNYFDVVLNLFTSFGYFEQERDDLATINAVYKSLKPNGIVVLDFMNSKKVIQNLSDRETKTIDGIDFKISKTFVNHFIIKKIEFSDKGKNYSFEERVKALTLADFEKYFEANKLKIVHLRGDYELSEFNESNSERLIIVAKKD
ncbi:MAG: methyltransferase domain-containing protein [Bacteroidetes bacterium]|nr:methyltransferase domain-containing protein [Bacteroidota bacterium]